MTIEEKAQRYNEALERARIWQEHLNESGDKDYAEELSYIFPDLKENEDVRVRKSLITFFQRFPYGSLESAGTNPKEAIDWLEKQSKHKLTHEDICKSYGIQNIGEFSDGYHTFNGLYRQRMILFAVLVKTYKNKAWKSWKHEDGLDCFGGGWFIVGIDTPAGTYTYHYESKDWDKFDCQILDKAKHWDGHDENDVERLFSLIEQRGKITFEAIKEEVNNQNCVKSDDKVDLKFHEGDWILYNNDICKIVKREEGCNILVTQFGIEKEPVNERNLSTAKLWDISCAKDGDVLVTVDGERPFIYKGCLDPKHPDSPVAYCGINADGYFHSCSNKFNHWWTEAKVHPATKEQKDALLKAMADAGYTFDFDSDKKELKKIEEKPQLKEGKFYECIKSYHHLCGSEYWFDEGKVYFCEKDGYLRSSKNNLINVYDCENWQNYFRTYTEKPLWSEEDEYNFNTIYHLLDLKKEKYKKQENREEFNRYNILCKWFKSLKDRCTWKPSEGQMEAMENLIINIIRNPLLLDNYTQSNIRSLCNDLRKLVIIR